jgi:hypothetical protein
MFVRLGLSNYAYSWRPQHIEAFEDEIEIAKLYGIHLLAWNFLLLDPDDPLAVETLKLFKRHGISPHLWVMHSVKDFPKAPEEWASHLPPGTSPPTARAEGESLSAAHQKAIQHALARMRAARMTNRPGEQAERVRQEAARIEAFARLAAPYGCRVALYNHGGWFGMLTNQLARARS